MIAFFVECDAISVPRAGLGRNPKMDMSEKQFIDRSRKIYQNPVGPKCPFRDNFVSKLGDYLPDAAVRIQFTNNWSVPESEVRT